MNREAISGSPGTGLIERYASGEEYLRSISAEEHQLDLATEALHEQLTLLGRFKQGDALRSLLEQEPARRDVTRELPLIPMDCKLDYARGRAEAYAHSLCEEWEVLDGHYAARCLDCGAGLVVLANNPEGVVDATGLALMTHCSVDHEPGGKAPDPEKSPEL